MRAVSDSSIQIDFEYKGIRCRERIRIQPTAANLKRAEQHRAAILDAIDRGTFDYAATFPHSPRRFLFAEYKGEGVLLEQYLESWIDRKKPHLKASTWEGYRKIAFNILIPNFGHIFLSDIKRPAIREWCERQSCGNKNLANILSVLRAALQDALDDELIELNPMYGWKYARKEAPKPVDDVDPFTADEQLAILDACRDPQHRNLFDFAFWTGLRTSELVALEWGDIDWRRGIVRVSRAKTQAGDVAEGTKTRRGTRDVKLLAPATAALERQKAHTFLAGCEVFHNPVSGKAWEGDQAIRKTAWQPALKKSGVRYRRPYQTRHTFASMMLTAGESPVWVAQQMGHSDMQMISRVYGRWIADAAPEAGGMAVKMFGKNVVEKLPKVGQ
ncbi:MAG: Arm DNA-binding domain-containing protein [Burkholderiales bacterium]